MVTDASVALNSPGTIAACLAIQVLIDLSSETMQVIASELLKGRPGTLKFILNDGAIVFFPASQQHRDIKVSALSYEDEHRGNALAGTITNERVEIRFHSAFSDERVKCLWRRVLALPEIANAGLGNVYYQGRAIA